jgi:hypothetical protein
MITKATLKPAQKGTKHLEEKYGERLVCVRYKYDEKARKRFTTVELIEEESEWISGNRSPPYAPNGQKRLAIRAIIC